jgi:hypothetical protein
MDKIKLILTLITIAITVVPIVGVLLTYQNNLVGLFVPPEINEIADKLSGGGGGDGGSDGPQVEPVGPPEYDPVSHTIRQSIAFKNTFPLDITLKSMSGDVQCVEHGFDVGVASIEEPVSIPVGETRTVTLLITWTDDGLAHFGSAQTQGGHAGEETVEVMLVNVSVDISGIQLQLDQNMMDQRMEIPNPAL